MTAPINVRLATTDDIPLLVVSFCKSFAEASAYADGVSKETLAGLLTRALLDWPAYVAVDPEDDETILGWIVGTGNVCAWVFVRPEYRGRGVGRALATAAHLSQTGSITTPFAPTRLKWLTDKRSIRFRPFLLVGDQ